VRTAIVESPIDVAKLLGEIRSPANGAAIVFVGTVRNVNEGRPVSGISYTAYRPMAEKELRTIAEEASTMFETPDVVVEHRIGKLALEDVSVAIAVATPHRAQAYDCSRYIIEELKKRVPIWKEELYRRDARLTPESVHVLTMRASGEVAVVKDEVVLGDKK
jgi:molybdopterin synthase catalytic subunit